MNTEAATQLDEIINQPSPQDILGAIIAYSGLEIFPSERQHLHAFIRNMKEEMPDAAAILSRFVFSKGADLYPFSRTLENSLVHLQLGGIIYAKNPEFDRLGMTGEAQVKMKENASKRFDNQSRQLLEKIGKAFAKQFS